MKDNMMQRIQSYQPYFDEWKFDSILKTYDNVLFINVVNMVSDKKAIIKIISIHEDIDNACKQLLDDYAIGKSCSPYYNYEKYYNNDCLDVCLLCKHEWLDSEPYFKDEKLETAIDLLEGRVCVQNEYMALELINDVIDHSDSYYRSKALLLLGHCYEEGIGLRKDPKKAFDCYIESAFLGNELAMANTGACYLYGIGLEENRREALYWIQKAIDKGCAKGFYLMGAYYASELKKDLAFKYYSLAARKNYSDAYSKLGYYFEEGIACEKDYDKAFYWYYKGVEDENPMVQDALGALHEKNKNNHFHESQAYYYYNLAYNQNYTPAIYHLGHCYEEGIGTCVNLDRALSLYKEAAEKGYSKAMYRYACLLKNKDEKLSIHYLLEATIKFDFDAMIDAAKIFEEGNDFIEKDEKRAYMFIDVAATYFKNAQANYILGTYYEKGIGCSRNYDKAFQSFWDASALGCVEATNHLGYCYEKGIGTETNLEVAFQYYRRGADAGYPESLYNLGRMYRYNKYPECNYDIALDLFQQAYDAYYNPAAYEIGLLYEEGLGVEKNMNEAFE
ncbi:MAG: sel1 repeat family protein [Clostridiales bacterium]|nr:sel1 repeat family protein [Clostridiales bacterium]